jgi:hypothetical protein
MIIPEEDNKEIEVKLTKSEIDLIIEELERAPHNCYNFLNYDKIINKLKNIEDINVYIDLTKSNFKFKNKELNNVIEVFKEKLRIVEWEIKSLNNQFEELKESIKAEGKLK